MADIAGLEPASCGFKSRSPYHYETSDSSTDRMLGYGPGDVGSIPPLTTISKFIDNHPILRSSWLKPVSWRTSRGGGEMAYAAALRAALCGFESRSPHPFLTLRASGPLV